MYSRAVTDRKLYARDAAVLAGVTYDCWRGYVNRGQAPPPDGTDIDKKAGRLRRYWWDTTVQTWLDNRPGQGARTDLTRRRAASDRPLD